MTTSGGALKASSFGLEDTVSLNAFIVVSAILAVSSRPFRVRNAVTWGEGASWTGYQEMQMLYKVEAQKFRVDRDNPAKL